MNTKDFWKSFKKRINYYKRIFSAYGKHKESSLSFWHEKPQVNYEMDFNNPATGYYMTFYEKAFYKGPFDKNGIPLLDYKGTIGKQYNPIAISQYALGLYNLYIKEKDSILLKKFLNQVKWLSENLERNKHGVYVWMHHFDWEYQGTLKSPWYSSLAQGNGISVLVRAYLLTGEKKYIDLAILAFDSFRKTIDEGGVTFIDKNGNVWFEEYIIPPYSHVLNGFIWSIWGVYDFYKVTEDQFAKNLFIRSTETLSKNLAKYDIGFWSLYALSPTKLLKLIASPFYHELHIVQLEIMYLLTSQETFKIFRDKWLSYKNSFWKRNLALIYKILFKLLYY